MCLAFAPLPCRKTCWCSFYLATQGTSLEWARRGSLLSNPGAASTQQPGQWSCQHEHPLVPCENHKGMWEAPGAPNEVPGRCAAAEAHLRTRGAMEINHLDFRCVVASMPGCPSQCSHVSMVGTHNYFLRSECRKSTWSVSLTHSLFSFLSYMHLIFSCSTRAPGLSFWLGSEKGKLLPGPFLPACSKIKSD